MSVVPASIAFLKAAIAASRVSPLASVVGQLLNAVAAAFFSTVQMIFGGSMGLPSNTEYWPRATRTPLSDWLWPTAWYKSMRLFNESARREN